VHGYTSVTPVNSIRDTISYRSKTLSLTLLAHLTENCYRGARAPLPKNRSQPAFLEPTVPTTNFSTPTSVPSLLSPSHLLQRFKQLSVLLHILSKQFISMLHLLPVTESCKETDIFVCNLSSLKSLLSQLNTTLSICHLYSTYYGSFSSVASLLSYRDRQALLLKTHHYCTELWNTLKFPYPPEVWYKTAHFISSLDQYIMQFHSQASTAFIYSSNSANHPSPFKLPVKSSKPSVIDQVHLSEITVDPYL